MHIRSIEPRDRDFFLSRNAAFYRSSACDHAIPPQNAERTFELLLHGTPYADCLIAEDDDGAPCAYLLLGAGTAEEDPRCGKPMHNEAVVFNEDILPLGAALHTLFALRSLADSADN